MRTTAAVLQPKKPVEAFAGATARSLARTAAARRWAVVVAVECAVARHLRAAEAELDCTRCRNAELQG